jgi:hypothetical protein
MFCVSRESSAQPKKETEQWVTVDQTLLTSPLIVAAVDGDCALVLARTKDLAAKWRTRELEHSRHSPGEPAPWVSMRKWLVIVALGAFLGYLLWPWLERMGLGRLPGDIVINRSGKRVLIPITTMLLVTAVLSGLFWLVRRLL